MKRALEGLPEVETANVDLATEQAEVRLKSGASLNLDAVRETVGSVVILPRVRRLLSKLKKAVGSFPPR